MYKHALTLVPFVAVEVCRSIAESSRDVVKKQFPDVSSPKDPKLKTTSKRFMFNAAVSSTASSATSEASKRSWAVAWRGARVTSWIWRPTMLWRRTNLTKVTKNWWFLGWSFFGEVWTCRPYCCCFSSRYQQVAQQFRNFIIVSSSKLRCLTTQKNIEYVQINLFAGGPDQWPPGNPVFLGAATLVEAAWPNFWWKFPCSRQILGSFKLKIWESANLLSNWNLFVFWDKQQT